MIALALCLEKMSRLGTGRGNQVEPDCLPKLSRQNCEYDTHTQNLAKASRIHKADLQREKIWTCAEL